MLKDQLIYKCLRISWSTSAMVSNQLLIIRLMYSIANDFVPVGRAAQPNNSHLWCLVHYFFFRIIGMRAYRCKVNALITAAPRD